MFYYGTQAYRQLSPNKQTAKSVWHLTARSYQTNTTDSPYSLRTANNGLHHIFSNLATVILMDIEGKGHLPQHGLPVLPVLTHHVLQVDGSCREEVMSSTFIQSHCSKHSFNRYSVSYLPVASGRGNINKYRQKYTK